MEKERVIRSQIQQRRCTRFAGQIDDLVVVCEAIEARGGELGVWCPVFRVTPGSQLQQSRHLALLGDDVNAVAGLTPDRVSDLAVPDTGVGCHKDLSNRMLMVEDDVGEVTVDPVGQIKHV